ncbi:leucyl/phenylalanyl-tRNA--protein transferase [Comamonas sp. lk]|uniref:leucyl/phenylalanyl-tRNA--protein transferase n=1 Tax=Comamonas sp. lk TaxID=2201272 RepID=UPI000EB5BB1B|nr:leucyl/phenylalanyl-tRNA--protein transferase [Comamonas sp. lk]
MSHSLPWLQPEQDFPPVESTWGEQDPIPGLLAAGGTLDASRLRAAYGQGIFPWFSDGQPVLWWSPNPRMVLTTAQFRLHRSLRKTLQNFRHSAHCEIRIDSAFSTVMQHCAQTPRTGQNGTWIVQSIVDAYTELHQQGAAHSVETWVDGELVGGLYCVALGRAVFGESMFALASDASKIALSALVALCRAQGAPQIDCQQATAHLSFMGAREIPRAQFLKTVSEQRAQPDMQWKFAPVYWDQLLSDSP